MLSAVLGTLIISDAGIYPIREDEIKILQNANLLDEDNKNLNLLNNDLLGLPRK